MAGGATPSASELLTFLIADVRGYTAYTQANGDEAAARLAAAFAEIVREGVEARDGRVIELRGDEALAVFTSARQAVRAAVEVQSVLVDEVERHPSMPLRAGIGLDAGDAIPVEDGYRGGALNLAARLCSQAGPGEVLASTGVRHLARAVDGLRFEERGALELKGMAEPVSVLRVLGDGSDRFADRLEAAARGPGTEQRGAVPRSLVAAGPLVPDREVQARRLRWAWRRARRGGGSAVVLVGGEGMGKTRMAAEVATVAAHDGASIVYIEADDAIEGLPGIAEPALVVVDGFGPDLATVVDDLVEGIESRALLLVVTTTDGPPPVPTLGGADTIVLESLSIDGVAEIVSLHAGEISGQAPLAAILEASAGVPARVHELVARWVRDESERRLRETAARAALGRSDLRALEAEVATGVIDLQLARERAELFGPAGEATFDGTVKSPYKGLATFEADDVDVFFGRERLVADMVGRAVGSTFLGVVGPSGSGKSSAVRAGLLPALAAGALPGSEGWIRLVTRPGRYPLRALDRAVWAALPDRLRAELESVELPLRALRDRLEQDERVVIVVDQFEELFTQTEDEDEREAFVGALVEAVDHPRGNAIVVAAIRADFYGRCAAYPRLAELLGASHVLVGPMTPDEFRRAIEGPARRAGLVVEPQLADALVREVTNEPGGLPLLSAALLELWQLRRDRTIPVDAYEATGGVRGAVGRLAESAYGTLDEDAQQVSRAVMLRLAGPGEGDAIVRRRVPIAEFDVDRNADVAAVLDAFTASRLLTVDEGTVEVAHEALLREWPRLGGWLEEDRAGIRLRGHMQVAASEWVEGGRDPGELYRGARLTSAMDWMGDHALELNDLEREFLQASRAASEVESERQRRSNRRLRALLVGVAAFSVLALVAGGLAAVQRNKAETAKTEATASRLGAQAVIEDDLDTSLLLAAQAREIDDSPDTRSALLASILKAPGAIAVLPVTAGRTNGVVGSPDGNIVAIFDNVGTVGIYDPESLALERSVEAPALYGADISPDGSAILGPNAGDIGPAYGWIDPATGEFTEIPLEGGRETLGQVAFDPDGRSFVSTELADEQVLLVRRSFPDMEEIDSLPLELTGAEFRMERALESDRIFVDVDAGLAVIDARSLRVVRTLEGVHSPFSPSPDGRVVGYGTLDGAVSFVDAATGAVTTANGRHGAGVITVSFSPDGETVVTTGDDRQVIVWDAATGSVREVLTGHAGKVFGTAFDAGAETAFTGGLDGLVIAWDLSTERRIGRRATFAAEEELCCLDNPGYALRPVASPDGRLLASYDIEGNVVMSDAVTGDRLWRADPWSDARIDELRELEPFFPDNVEGYVSGIAFTPDGTSLAVGGGNPEAVVLDVGTGEAQRRIVASHQGWVNDVAFTPDARLVTTSDDGRLVVWDEAGEPAQEFQVLPEATTADEYPGVVGVASPSPDGSALAVLADDWRAASGRVLVFDLATGDLRWQDEIATFSGSLGWSTDSSTLAIGADQTGMLELRDAGNGAPIGEPVEASAGFVLTVGFSEPLSLWVTSGSDGTVRLFDAATLRQVGSHILADDNRWATATVVAGGDAMVVASEAGHVWRWDLHPDRWTEQACGVAGRVLTEEEWAAFLPDRSYEPACQ